MTNIGSRILKVAQPNLHSIWSAI